MKPDWDKLMDEFKDSETALVADVDCTAAGKPLCDSNGVRGFPTIKYGDPDSLEDYQGGRDFASLKKFADENLKPLCSIKNIELCDEDQKKEIEKFQGMEKDALQSLVDDKQKAMKDAEENFKKEVEKLQEKYTELMQQKDNGVAEAKEGLGVMKQVLASKE